MSAVHERSPVLVGALSGSVIAAFNMAWVALAWSAGAPLGDAATGNFLVEGHPVSVLLLAIVWAPLWETLIAQLIPLELLARCDWRLRVLVSALLFSGGHVLSGAGMGQALSTLVGGAAWALLYLAFRQRGRSAAFAAAAAGHAANNLIVLAVVRALA